MSEFIEYEPRLNSAKKPISISAGLNLEKFNTIVSGTNHIVSNQDLNVLNLKSGMSHTQWYPVNI